jgi:hypothetical protein
MAQTELLTEVIAVAADGIHSASQSAAEKLTGAIDLGSWRGVLFIIDSGTLGTSGTLDFQIKGSATSGGTYTAISGTAITQLVKATDDNKYVLVYITAEKVVSLGLGYRFLKGSLLPGTAAANSSVTAIGWNTRFNPANAIDATSVSQILNVFR